ncbi:MAG TPA: tRNA 2-selenouridine(34) synthase MnmH [Cyclobacteriaceae bacterium]
MTIDINTFLNLRSDLPMVDVRSQKEFQEGHIPGAINIPLLNNEERIAVGTDYKQKGQLEAIKTGFRLVGPRLPEIIDAAEAISKQREILVHCWRGGMRSNNFCQFIGMARIKSHSLQGGYKAYRQLAMESFKKPFQFMVLSGYTGSGKSEVLRTLAKQGEQIIDLELLAKHKGSAFGGIDMPHQPTTEQFQNNLFEAILKLDVTRRIWIEDESIAIGKIFLPQPFWQQMNASPVVEMIVPKEKRINRLVNEYGSANKEEFLQAMERITRKLGGQHFNTAKEKLLQGDMPAVMELLLTYYDKAYQISLKKKHDRIKHEVEWSDDNLVTISSSLNNLRS